MFMATILLSTACRAVAADMFGYEAALFFPSGTQSNLAALMAHCGRGDEYLVGQEAHTYKYEQGGAAVLGSIQPQPLQNEPDGTIPQTLIAAAIKPADIHFARTRLLALENTIGDACCHRTTSGESRSSLTPKVWLRTWMGREFSMRR